jgi:hypothetical protein
MMKSFTKTIIHLTLSLLLNILFLPLSHAIPIPIPNLIPRSPIAPLPRVDPSQDTWSSTLSGVGPLILLIGEKSTKQVLRSVRSLPHALSLGTAPLGLFSLVASFLRLCGLQWVRGFMGYEAEPRLKAAVELTGVNCGGVFGRVVDGWVERACDDDAGGRVVGVRFGVFEGASEEEMKVAGREMLEMVESCQAFEERKWHLGVPAQEATVDWCLRMRFEGIDRGVVERMVKNVVGALGIMDAEDATLEIVQALPQFNSEGGIGAEGKSSFTFIFPAVSEMSTRAPTTNSVAGLVGVFSFLSILTLQLLELRRLGWRMSVGLILVFVGYMGICCFVTTAALRIKDSCAVVKLRSHNKDSSKFWLDGLAFTSKTNDNMDTSGTKFWATTESACHVFEAIWLKEPTLKSCCTSTFVALALIASFICHYLGLRSCSWWVTVGELGICLLAAFGRSITKERQEKLRPVDCLTIDWRCASTGVIDVRAAEKIELRNRVLDSMDIRIYSEDLAHRIPNSAESIAWYVALQIFQNESLANGMLRLTGAKIFIHKDSQPKGKRAVIAFFHDGIISSDGIVFPNTGVGVAFKSRITNLAAPTLLLARGLFRHAEWFISNTELHQVPLGAVHKPSLSSLLSWWTLSENRNDLADTQNNLQYALFYLNVAFFVGLLEVSEQDQELGESLHRVHAGAAQSDRQIADGVVEFLKASFEKCHTVRMDSNSTMVQSPGLEEQEEKL